MQETIGRDSSTSQPSSWADDQQHNGKHFTLLTFPDGKLVLTTPDNISEEEFDAINVLFKDWIAAANAYPLVIGNCKVVMAPVAPRMGSVRRV